MVYVREKQNWTGAAKRSVSLTSSVLESTEPVPTASCKSSPFGRLNPNFSNFFAAVRLGPQHRHPRNNMSEVKPRTAAHSPTLNHPTAFTVLSVRPVTELRCSRCRPAGWLNSLLGNRAAGSGSFGQSQVFLPRCLLLAAAVANAGGSGSH